MKKFTISLTVLLQFVTCTFIYASISTRPDRNFEDSVKVRSIKVEGNVYMLDCINGFGGGNVAASVGEDGILLVDDMYATMTGQIKTTLSAYSTKPIRIVLNTHFHGDHIQGNVNFGGTTVIIGHENIAKRVMASNSPKAAIASPKVTFKDSLSVYFNGEEIKMIHYPNAHTDGDAAIYFTKSKVLHLGDMFFFEMFPAVYTEGGGNIKQLIVALDKILARFPADTHVIPGHGSLATMKDLADYTAMLKETVATVEKHLKAGETLAQMKEKNILQKYNALGDGGAQTTDQYLAMLVKLLSN